MGREFRDLWKVSEGSQWEEENITGLEEFGEMTEDTWRERRDWLDGIVVKFGV